MRGCGQKRQAVAQKWKASGDKERKSGEGELREQKNAADRERE